MLIQDLLNEGYQYILTSTFQSGPLERHVGKYRQMNGGNFLVSLRGVNNSKKILKIRSLIKEDIDIFESDIFCKSNAEERRIQREIVIHVC